MADQSPEAAFKQQVAQYFDQLEKEMAEVKNDVEKFTIKDNVAAGTRVRLSMQKIKDLGQRLRVAVQNAKEAGKNTKK